ncbi:MAG TPA: SulP family inorganic anion transporter [Anaerolineae bacterium]|nr:SulP family inorganic anion transporter [Anaerolineae bacterium]
MTTTVDKPRRSAGDVIKSYLPILAWLPKYQKDWFRPDLIAALTLWALLVPEAMAYAGIAGMPPETGLYAAPLALVAYAIFGTSRHLDVGPSSAVAALSFSVVAGILGASAVQSEEWVLLSIALALMVGVFLIIGGFLRLGVLADFLSRPVLDGFVVGVAISIAIGQLDKVLGFEPEGYDFVPDLLLFITDIDMIHWPTAIVGAISLVLLFALHKFTPKLPAALIVLFLAIAVSSLLDFESAGIHVVGEIPAGLPEFGIPEGLGLDELLVVAPGAIGVALVAFAESVAIARSYGTKLGYEVDANQELIAVGASNLGSGFSGAFVVDGSMSRTAAAVGAGAKTQMVSLIAAVAILITAAALTPIFANLPEATLGAIVIHAVWHNISFSKISQYRSITNLDYATAIVAMIGVLALGLLQGLVLAALLGLIVLLFGTKHRNTSVLGRVPETTVYRDIEHYPEGETYPGLLIIRFDGTLFFANAHDFVTAVRQAIAAADPPPRIVLIDGESINDIDATAVITVKEFQKQLRRTGIELRVARVKTQVLDVMRRAGLEEAIPAEHIYPTVQAAVDAYLAENEKGQATMPNE